MLIYIDKSDARYLIGAITGNCCALGMDQLDPHGKKLINKIVDIL